MNLIKLLYKYVLVTNYLNNTSKQSVLWLSLAPPPQKKHNFLKDILGMLNIILFVAMFNFI